MSLLLTGCTGAAVETAAEVSQGTPVEVQQLKRSTIRNELTYIGQVEPAMTISVISQLSAEVQNVNFEIGDRVESGAVLFSVDSSDLQDQIRQLEASAVQTEIALLQAQYGLEVAEEGSAQERLTELQYESGIYSARYGSQSAVEARSSTKDARDLLEDVADGTYSVWQAEERIYQEMKAVYDANTKENPGMYDGEPMTEERLAAQGITVSKAQRAYQDAIEKYEAAESGYTNSRIGVNQADKSLDFAYENYEAYKELADESKERSVRNAQFGVMTAEASVNTMQTQLLIAQNNLGKTVITSPISGVISARNVNSGEMISPTMPAFTIVDIDTVKVQVNVSEALINSIYPGDEVQVVIQAISDQPLTGTVSTISPVASGSSTYPVKVQLDNTNGTIKPGMFSQVSFVAAQQNNTFVVDKNVVMSDETTQYVYIVENGNAKRVNVTTGLSNGEEIEITSGVSENQDIVVVGQEYLHDGTQVNIVKRDGVSVNGQDGQVSVTAQPEPEVLNVQDEDGEEEDEMQDDASAEEPEEESAAAPMLSAQPAAEPVQQEVALEQEDKTEPEPEIIQQTEPAEEHIPSIFDAIPQEDTGDPSQSIFK